LHSHTVAADERPATLRNRTGRGNKTGRAATVPPLHGNRDTQMTPSPTLRHLLTELEASLHRLEAHSDSPGFVLLRGPLLRRRRAVAALRRQLKLQRRTMTAPATTSNPTLSDLIEGERRLIDAYRAALIEAQSNPALRQLLSLQKSESEQALLTFSSSKRRS
jgi:hypothetical protein